MTVRCDGADVALLCSCLAGLDVTIVTTPDAGDAPDAGDIDVDVCLVTRIGVADRVVPERWAGSVERAKVAVLVHPGDLDAASAAAWISRALDGDRHSDTWPAGIVPADAEDLPRLVRRAVRDAWPVDERVDLVLLAASEVASNAVQHAMSRPEARISADAQRLVIEAIDDQPSAFPCLSDPTLESPSDGLGHGLRIVDAVADRWGVTVGPGRKVVWCEFDRPS